MGTWPGPSFITWTSLGPGAAGELALGVELGELGLVVGVGDAAGAEAVADGEDTP
jgi:hypothetical protein